MHHRRYLVKNIVVICLKISTCLCIRLFDMHYADYLTDYNNYNIKTLLVAQQYMRKNIIKHARVVL